jgi:heme iron utilization protein
LACGPLPLIIIEKALGRPAGRAESGRNASLGALVKAFWPEPPYLEWGNSGVRVMNETPPPQPDFDGASLAKHLLRTVRAGALATLDRESGYPFASLVTVATDCDGSPLLLMSRLAAHTGNLEQDPRASILLAQGGKGDPLAHPRLTVLGQVARSEEPRVRARFLARHPKAKLYAGFGDFSFWRMEITGAHLNGGFARAMTLSAGQIRTDLAGAEELAGIEDSALDHMNEDHREALALYATRLADAPAADWRATGLDPEGIDLGAGDLTARVDFPRRVENGTDVRKVLKEMAERARSLAA